MLELEDHQRQYQVDLSSTAFSSAAFFQPAFVIQFSHLRKIVCETIDIMNEDPGSRANGQLWTNYGELRVLQIARSICHKLGLSFLSDFR